MEKNLNKSKIPHALERSLNKNPKISEIKNFKTKSYPSLNNFELEHQKRITKITKVKSFTKRPKIIERKNYTTSTEAISHQNLKKKLNNFHNKALSQKNSSSSLKKLNSNKNTIENNLSEKSKNVKVFIRFRPANEVESSLLQNNYGYIVPRYISETQLGIFSGIGDNPPIPDPKLIFSFDKIFTPKSTQGDIYTSLGSRLVEDIMTGYNGTIFAYGQSGSGKTYTMYGEDIFDERKKGIIPRIISEIFTRMEKIEDVDFTLKLSVLEIYKEILYDLFSGKNNLKIIENKDKIYIENLSQVYLSNLEEFFDYTELSQRNRKVAETKLNHNSSRSHCIMILEVIQNFKKEKIIKKGILNLVDLAGSEKVSKTGAVGETLEEAKKINLSLSTLGNVIHALTSKDSKGHIPFRDSKLTRILKESLGGNYKTYLIVTCSPHSFNLDEIISSLNFAKRVKCIKNKFKINIKYSYEELQNLVTQLNEKINKLKKGEKVDNNYNMNSINLFTLEEKKNMENKLKEKENEIVMLKNEIENLKNNNKHIPKKFEFKQKKYNNNFIIKSKEIEFSINSEKNKENELNELYKKIKETLNKIQEENERIKIIQKEEEEIRKINLKKEQFNEIINDFIQNNDKIKCFENMDNIIKKSIPLVKEKNYKKIFEEFKTNINEIFYVNNSKIIRTKLFLEYLSFYFSSQIINQGYLKLLLDNNSLNKMNKYLFSIVQDILFENQDIANENAINANAISFLRASIRDSMISKHSNLNTTFNDLNKKMVKVISKQNLGLKKRSSIKLDDLRNSGLMGDNNNKMFINKMKSQEYEKHNGKINMIKNVLVNIVKETDKIKNDIKEIKENIHITLKSIMNYICQKMIKIKNVELDINNNLIIEKNNTNNTNNSYDRNNEENKENIMPNNEKIFKVKKFGNLVPKQIKKAKGDDFDYDNNFI